MTTKFTPFIPSRKIKPFVGILLLLVLFPFAGAMGQVLQPQSIDIPMSDGKTLAADLYLPSQSGSYPVVLIQTPYNKNLFQLGLPLGVGQDIENSPYAFVVLDWRCFYGSLAACTLNPDRGQDGYASTPEHTEKATKTLHQIYDIIWRLSLPANHEDIYLS